MKSFVVPVATLFLSLLTYSGVAQAQSSEQTPDVVKQTCFMCHSQEGNNPDLAFVPRLAHQNDTYIVEQLKAFRDGSRAGPPGMLYMWPISQSLTENQIKVAAKWYADQPPPTPFPEDPAVNAVGKDIFEHGILKSSVAACSSCHGPKAAGNGIFPRLAGQTPQYLLAQLRYFNSGVRNDKNADVMKPIASHLTEEQMNAVSHYISTL
ncbi:MAG TPA: c-type cytochrome [Pseudomonadales bacterium]|nr:c-type cytochrome [Pseudomonadales bacterium]